MTKLQSLAFIGLAFAVLTHAFAAEPASQGRVLLLAGDRVMEGEIERIADRYRVRRGDGEVTFPAESVVFVGPDLKSVYEFKRGKIEPANVEQHLQLARWCFQQNLREFAIVEADAALKLAPNSTEAKECHRLFSRAEVVPVPQATAPIQTPAVTPIESTDCSAEALKQFHMKVQPILANACVNCHSSDRGGAFRLKRSTQPADLQANLAATLKQIDRAEPQRSALLRKATTIHGGDRQPLKEGSPAHKNLEAFVKLVAGQKPAVVKAPAESPGLPAGETASKPAPAAAADAPIKDPFDPEIFNRMRVGGR